GRAPFLDDGDGLVLALAGRLSGRGIVRRVELHREGENLHPLVLALDRRGLALELPLLDALDRDIGRERHDVLSVEAGAPWQRRDANSYHGVARLTEPR